MSIFFSGCPFVCPSFVFFGTYQVCNNLFFFMRPRSFVSCLAHGICSFAGSKYYIADFQYELLTGAGFTVERKGMASVAQVRWFDGIIPHRIPLLYIHAKTPARPHTETRHLRRRVYRCPCTGNPRVFAGRADREWLVVEACSKEHQYRKKKEDSMISHIIPIRY